jgi:hypothetical protein
MSESIKNLNSTMMRVAGNICAGLVGTPYFQGHYGVARHQELVALSVDLARQIVRDILPPVEGS